MKFAKLISALAIIMAISIAPTTGVFAQSDVASDEINDKKIYKEERKQFFDSIKDQRKALTDQIKDFKDQRKDITDNDRIRDVEPTLEFKGETSGWAVIGGNAHPATFSLDGKTGQVGERGWQLSGTGTVVIGDRNVTFDLRGFANNNHINIKGISQDDETISIHLRGNFAPIAESENSFALAFTRAAITDSDSDVNVLLVLVGDAVTSPIIPTVDDTETTDSVDELLDDQL